MKKGQNIACFDVYYRDYAWACCLVFKNNSSEKIIAKYLEKITPVNKYISGEFYKRELPCLLEVYAKVREEISLAIVDGFVLLERGKNGLGGYLYEALNQKTPVIGVAKTFHQGCENYRKIYRGKSLKPLFVSCIGIELDYAAQYIKNLAGENRIPNILKEVDRLTRLGEGNCLASTD